MTGVGNGARVAAAVGTRCRGNLAGFILMGYPLKARASCLLVHLFYIQLKKQYSVLTSAWIQEPMPSNKGGPAPDSVCGSCWARQSKVESNMQNLSTSSKTCYCAIQACYLLSSDSRLRR